MNLVQREIAKQLRNDMKRAVCCPAYSIPPEPKIVIVGEAPPPTQSHIEKTSIWRLCALSNIPNLLHHPDVYHVNVNQHNPGVRRRGSKAPNRQEATLAAWYILSGRKQQVFQFDDLSIVFVLLGNSVAKAFRMYEEHSPEKYPLFHLYELPTRIWENEGYEIFYNRFVVRLPHPSNAHGKRNDTENVSNLMKALGQRLRR